MLKKLQIRGFRTHKKTNIKLDQVTTLTGQTFIGKSNIVRALKWVVLNVPAGDSYINWDMEKAAVRLSIDKNIITRTRSKSVNTYQVKGKKKPYEALGRCVVPKDIKRILNITELNFQGQHTYLFWFILTPGAVAKELNAIINLDIIDTTMSNIKSKIMTIQTEIKITEKEIEESQQQKKRLEYIIELDKALKSVEKLQEQQETIQRELRLLDELLKLVSNYTLQRDKAEELVIAGERILKKRQKMGLIKLQKQISSLQGIIGEIKHYKQLLKTLGEELLRGQRELKRKMKGRCPLCKRKM